MINAQGFDPKTGEWNDSLTGDYRTGSGANLYFHHLRAFPSESFLVGL